MAGWWLEEMLIARSEVWDSCRSILEIQQGHPRILSNLGLALVMRKSPTLQTAKNAMASWKMSIFPRLGNSSISIKHVKDHAG